MFKMKKNIEKNNYTNSN